MTRKWLEVHCGTARLPQVMGRFFLGIIVLSVLILLGMYLHVVAL